MHTGILGGTFDPIHLAHLHAGETALYQAGLDRVLFMPAGEPWQKSDRALTGAAHRLEMIRLAIADIDGFEVDDREIEREGPTYTIDTLLSFPESERLSLILGADAALGLPTWQRWEEVLDRASLLVVPRPGTDAREVQAILPEAVFLDMAVLEISGTEIREMAAIGEPFRFLVPLAVYDYIESVGLYAEPGGDDMVGDSSDQEEGS
ncbi:MAG TPA: nicotinate-nucleotide adenylyltransferase [Acidimicrobiia bacterium]